MLHYAETIPNLLGQLQTLTANRSGGRLGGRKRSAPEILLPTRTPRTSKKTKPSVSSLDSATFQVETATPVAAAAVYRERISLQMLDERIARLEEEVSKLRAELKDVTERMITASTTAAKLEGQLTSQAAVELNQKGTIEFLKALLEKK